MIKRTIEISQEPAHLTVRDDQLLILSKDDSRSQLASIPCEDIGVLLSEHRGTTYGHAALERLLFHGAVVVICGRDHLPAGLLLPVGEHTRVVSRIHVQIALSKPAGKRLWKQIVQAKIRGQAGNLPAESSVRSKLLSLARGVRSGDPSNVEAQAAKAYWGAYGELLEAGSFRRAVGGCSPNNMLNYGYAVMRAAMARALVAAGLVPALGIHHHNRANAFCLADDLMEPLRPLVDDRVAELYRQGYESLIPQVKAGLLELLTLEVRIEEQSGPLMVALHRMVGSLVRCYEGVDKRLLIPVPES